MRPLSGGACVLATVTALLVDCVALQISSFEQSGVVQLGTEGQFFDFGNIRCLITDPPADLVTRWVYGPSVFDNSSMSDRHSVMFNPVPGNSDLLVSDLLISNLSYADNGTYVCQAKSASDSTWLFASVELVLRVFLESVASVTTYDNVSETELTCAMSGYAPPNLLLKWYRGISMLSNDSKYAVLYRDNPDGSSSIQRGSGEENSILGVLAISNPAEGDSGTYYCRIDGYDLEASVQLEVQSTGTVDNIGVVGEQESMSTESGDNTGSNNQMITIIIAAVAGFLGLIVFILLVIIVVVACQRCRRVPIVIESGGTTLTELPLVKPAEDMVEEELPPPIPARTHSQSSSRYMTSSQNNDVPDLIRSYNSMHQPVVLPPKPEPQIQTTFPYYDRTDDTKKVPAPEYPSHPEPRRASGKKRTYYDQVLLKTETGTNSLPGASGFSLASVPSPHDVLSGSLQRQQNPLDFAYPAYQDGFTPEDLAQYDSVENDYDQIYSEPIEPAMLHGSSSEEHMNHEAVPYSAIYDDPRPLAQSEAPLEVTNDNIIEIRKLGTGQFGNVILARTKNLSLMDLKLSETNSDRNYSILVAVKKLKTNAESGLYEAFEKEVKFMSRLNHDNVVRLLGVNWKDECFIMMEYMENGDLNQFLQKLTLVPDTVVGLREMEITPVILLYLGVQIASGMHYLASRRFVHRDLATRNCLVGKDFVVKISDFGMSRRLYESAYYRVQGTLVLPIRWMACETFYGKFSVKSDSWAFGVTLWELYTLASCDPYEDMSDEEVIQDAIRGPSRKLLPRPGACPKEVYDVMLRCWVSDPAMRADFGEIYSRLYMTYTSQAL